MERGSVSSCGRVRAGSRRVGFHCACGSLSFGKPERLLALGAGKEVVLHRKWSVVSVWRLPCEAPYGSQYQNRLRFDRCCAGGARGVPSVRSANGIGSNIGGQPADSSIGQSTRLITVLLRVRFPLCDRAMAVVHASVSRIAAVERRLRARFRPRPAADPSEPRAQANGQRHQAETPDGATTDSDTRRTAPYSSGYRRTTSQTHGRRGGSDHWSVSNSNPRPVWGPVREPPCKLRVALSVKSEA